MTGKHRKTQWKRFGWLLHGIGVAVLALGAMLGSVCTLSPIRKSAEENNDRITTLTRLLRGADEIRAEHAKLSAQLAETEQRAAEIRQRIPEHPSEADFLKELTQAAKDQGLVIRDYRRGALKTADTHSQLEVMVIAEGGYQSICRFVDQVANLSRISKIERLYIESDEPGEMYPIEITFVLYFGLQPNAAALATRL